MTEYGLLLWREELGDGEGGVSVVLVASGGVSVTKYCRAHLDPHGEMAGDVGEGAGLGGDLPLVHVVHHDVAEESSRNPPIVEPWLNRK